MKYNIKWLLILHIVLGIYAVSSTLSKFASGADVLSVSFIALYGCAVLLLAVYAIGWQQVIKHLPLTTAYTNKSVTVIWGMVLGMVIFNESISVKQIIGAAFIVAGIFLFVDADRRCQNG